MTSRRLPSPYLALALALVAGCVRQVRTTGPEGPGTVSVRWRAELRESIEARWKPEEFGAPAVTPNLVIVGVHGGGLHALDRDSGKPRWKALAVGVSGKPLWLPGPEVAGKDGKKVRQPGTLYVGADDGGLYALDDTTGKVRWRFLTKGTIEHAPLHRDGLLYFTTSENRLYAIAAQDGKWKWQYEREGPEQFTIRGFSGAAFVERNVCTGFSDGYLACVNPQTGEVQWARSLASVSDQFVDVDSTPVLHGGVLYAASYSGGVYALYPRDGAVKWRFPIEGAGTLVPADGRLYFSAGAAGLHAIDGSGRVVWRQVVESAGALTEPVLGPAGSMLVGGSDSGLYVVQRDTGALRAFFAPGRGFSAPPLVDGRTAYALSNGGFLYMLEL